MPPGARIRRRNRLSPTFMQELAQPIIASRAHRYSAAAGIVGIAHISAKAAGGKPLFRRAGGDAARRLPGYRVAVPVRNRAASWMGRDTFGTNRIVCGNL